MFPGGGVAPAGVVATGGGLVISGGNFHGEPIALALDFAKIAVAELGSIAERRIALLVDARLNGGLPAFLAASSGVDSGMMIHQYTAAALVSEDKVLAHPASVDSIPTSANQEDHVSMGAIAARHARAIVRNVEQIVAIELIVAAQALDARLALLPGHAARRRASPRPIGGSGRSCPGSRATASRARTWQPPPSSSGPARSPISSSRPEASSPAAPWPGQRLRTSLRNRPRRQRRSARRGRPAARPSRGHRDRPGPGSSSPSSGRSLTSGTHAVSSRIRSSDAAPGSVPIIAPGRRIDRTSGGMTRARTAGSRTSSAIARNGGRPGSRTSTCGSARRLRYHSVEGP